MLEAINQAKNCKSVLTAFNVGAVLVYNSEIISTGYSREYPGNTHAEEVCFLKLKSIPPEAILYTTMEPCSTRLSGKTSCSQRILDSGIKTVIIGIKEPNNFVNCKGIEILKNQGIKVKILDTLKNEIKSLNSHLNNE